MSRLSVIAPDQPPVDPFLVHPGHPAPTWVGMQAMLKRIAIALVAIAIPALLLHPWSASASGSFDKKACTVNGHKLYGKIKEVTGIADVTVRVTSGIADLKVKKVSAFADSCGEWEMTTGIADTTVRFVTGIADVTIRYTDSFPGVD